MSERRRHLLVLLIVLGLIAGSAAVLFTHSTKLGLDLQGGVRLVYQGKPTKQTKVTAESLQRALDIMRDRVDAFGVSEPELARTGEDQIEVNLPGVEDAERAAQQVGSTAQLFFYDWEKNVLDENCKTNETEIDGGQQPVTGLYNAVKRAVEVRDRGAEEQPGRGRARASTPSTRSPRSRSTTACPTSPREASLEGLSDAEKARAEVIEVKPGVLVLRDEKPQREGAGPGRASGSSATTRASRARTSRTPSRTSTTGRRQRADRHLRLQRQGPEGVPEDHQRGRPARRRQRQPAEPGPGVELAPLRDRARQRARLDPVHQLPREPGRHRRLDRRADLRRLHDHERAGPGEGAQDRRAAAEARPDLALAGLRHARQAGAQPGPQGGHRGLPDRRASSCSSSTACWASSRPSRSASTPSTSTRSSS